MTRRVFALLVGIDRYQAVGPLQGCHNDVLAVRDYLRVRAGVSDPQAIRLLANEDATRSAVIAGLREHLGQAGPGDTALFWFSGHGSWAPVPQELSHLEPSGRMQTLVCHDSRHDQVPDLYDKELLLLCDEIAGTGAHLAVVLDSCHSQSATRDLVRYAPASTTPPRLEALLPQLRQVLARPPTQHVALAACRSNETAGETWADGRAYGLFSWSLLSAMRRLAPSTTYRDLLVAARCEVERQSRQQVPQLEPVTPGIADQPFLGGRVTLPAIGIRMRRVRGEWEIDAGSCHGLSLASPEQDVRVAVPGPLLREARIARVHPERSVVAPLGWEPDEDTQYPVVLSRAPLPRVTVAVDGIHRSAADSVLTALASAGPGGGPSPHVRPAEGGADLLLDVRLPDRVHIRDSDGFPLCPELALDDGGRRVVLALEHLARVHQIKALVNPISRLTGAVGLELVEARPGEPTAPAHRPPLLPGGDGTLHLRYRWEQGSWRPPTVFIRLRNNSDRPLFFVLLNITERHRVHATLFAGDHVAPRQVGAALYGRAVEFTLPAGDPVRPGARTRDWLLLLAAEEQFSSAPFELPAIEDISPDRRRSPLAVAGLLGRLGLAAVHRDAGVAGAGASDWITLAVPVVTEVPAGSRAQPAGERR
ncbi:caspase family protein [Micromonospora sp. DT229]|uniref:caspase family protein n=1 Tax=Micromonospora sp. DT229 TaxID=3393430 RepID=UPI003CF70523